MNAALSTLCIHLLLAALGLSCGTGGLCFGMWASLELWHRGSRAHGFYSCGPWAPLSHGMWTFPIPGIEPMFLALAGRFLATDHRELPPGDILKSYPTAAPTSSFCTLVTLTPPICAIPQTQVF